MRIPIGISNRHIHLSQIDADKLFGKGYEFKVLKNLSQPGQFAYEETVVIKGPIGEIKNVRILGPVRKQTQVEIFVTDNYILGCNAPIRLSGDLKGSESLTVIGPKGSVYLQEGVIIAKRHLHITQSEADDRGLKNNQKIKIKTNNGERGLIFDNVLVRITDSSALDFHIDMEEANASGLKMGDWGEIIK
ncbi:phosphate propanoyltransferase [Candidatus Gracilibacteria bacterium]|nr:phosphate propanoyltransferase [Candidatus Gracilibacteria bacterium]